MASYYDSLNDFFDLNEREHFASSAQLVYLHLLHLNNRSGNGGSVQVSDRQLETMTSLAKQSITRAKQILKNRGLIDFKTQKGKPTTITLPLTVGHPVGQSVGHLVGHLVGHPVGQSETKASSLVRETRETREKDAAPSPSPCPAPSPAPSPTPLSPPSPTPLPSPPPPINQSINQSAHARANASPESGEASGSVSYTPDELGELMDYWEEKLRGGRLTVEHQSELLIYLNSYGMEWVKEAMKEATDANNNPYGIRPKFLFSVLKSRVNPKPKKEVKKIEQRANEYAKPPEDTGNEPWGDF